jgi:lysozyme
VPKFTGTLFALATLLATAALAQDKIDVIPSQSQVEDFSVTLGIAPDENAAPPLNDIAIKLIKHFEGWSAAAYTDPAGYCTIGYGHLIALHPCEQITLAAFENPITRDGGEHILNKDTFTARLAVHDLITTDIDANEYGALSSFAYNVGKRNFTKSTLLKLVNSGNSDLAGDEFGRWVKGGGRVLPGLITRRACEASLFRGELKLNSNGEFDPASCQTLGAAPSGESLIDIDSGER